MISNLKSQKGFTLIELLVVISIIGVLSTLLFANFVGVRERGRDATRKSDISQIQKALELYKNSKSPPAYPATASLGDLVTDPANAIKALPHDPLCTGSCSTNTWPDYKYERDPDILGDNRTYKLVACLDNASDPQKDTAKNAYCADPSKASYTRTEP